MKINLGCGPKYLGDGSGEWVNVDLYAERVDVKADIRTVEFAPGCAELVHCIHVIEHIELREGISLIRRAAEWLAPGGKLVIETPDRDKCRRLIKQGNYSEGAKGLFGGRSIDKKEWHAWLLQWATSGAVRDRSIRSFVPPERWNLPGEQHLHVWAADELKQAMEKAGLSAAIESPLEHGRRAWRDSRVVGTKPE